MTTADPVVSLEHSDHFFIDGSWVRPSSDDSIDVIDSTDEHLLFNVAAAAADDMRRAVGAARRAFDDGPWPRLTHVQRAEYLTAMAAEIRARIPLLTQIWVRESGALSTFAEPSLHLVAQTLDFYARLAQDYPFEERVRPTTGGEFGLIVREPVGVVGAIVPWNGPLPLAVYKLAPALLAGCTAVLKSSPEAPGASYVLSSVAEAVGLPAGVLNTLTADREVSELLVRDPRVDKIAFTGSTAAGRRIGSICGERVARMTLELGGKSAAVVLDDVDLGQAAASLSGAECLLTGQVCASLTRIIVSKHRHDELLEALASSFGSVRVGDPFEPSTQMGPLAMERQRTRVEEMVAAGVHEGATLATGGGRPKDLERGFYVEPTVFGHVDNSFRIAREEIFGPVLSVIPAEDEQDAIRIANDSEYGLNASVYTDDIDRARVVAGQLRSGTVGHNNFRADLGIAFGGFKQSGIGREGGREGLLPYLETKTVVLEGVPARYLTS